MRSEGMWMMSLCEIAGIDVEKETEAGGILAYTCAQLCDTRREVLAAALQQAAVSGYRLRWALIVAGGWTCIG